MCDCLNQIAEQYADEYKQYDKRACVYAEVSADVEVAPWVLERRQGFKKGLRRAKSRKHFGIPLNFCPLCGARREGYQAARVWND